ncbi:MAG: hypothetical protein JW915_12030 [Chitinispirillaceae bacterium]|nr:hypothetical protein [Chitinispirillaceae bacterium]
MKLAVAGKGGAGKTMVASTLSYIFAQKGDAVYAIDADPNPTFGQALGFPESVLCTIQPVISLKELIRERTGAGDSREEAAGTYFRLNPRVDDIPDRYCGTHRAIRLLIMGATRGPGTGCACAENTVIKALVSHLVLRVGETVIMDMVAGTEHIGRGTASGVNALIVVVEPSNRSILAARSVLDFSKQIQGLCCRIVGNKIRSVDDKDFIRDAFPDYTVNNFISWNENVLKAENASVPVFDTCPDIVETLKELVADLEDARVASLAHSS